MFKSVKAKNFISWEELEFNFNTGVTLITGFNNDDNRSNGSGKSSVLNALSWCLFGAIPKDVKVDDVIREGQKSCHVEVLLDNGVTVSRNRKPNDLRILLANGEILRGKDAKETQGMIEEMIGLSFEAFCQSIYFPQNSPQSFLRANSEEKAKILSELQELSVFDKARKAVQETAKSSKEQLTLAEREFLNKKALLEMSESQAKEYQTMKVKAEKDQAVRIQALQDYIKEQLKKGMELKAFQEQCKPEDLEKQRLDIEAEIEKATAEVNAAGQAMAELRGKDVLKKQLERQIDEKASQIKRLTDKQTKNLDKNCPTCGTNLEKADPVKIKAHQAEIQAEIDEVKSSMKALQKQVAELPTAEDEAKAIMVTTTTAGHTVRTKKAELKTVETELLRCLSIQERVNAVEVEVERYNEAIKAEQTKGVTDYDKAIAKAELQANEVRIVMEGLSKKVAAFQLELAQLETLKDGFKEVKAYVFQSILADLTIKANHYIQELFEMPLQISFGNEGEEGEISKIHSTVVVDGVERPLGLFSGGQEARLQMATNLALAEIVAARGHNPINLRIFDEPFHNFDDQSVESAITLLQRLGGTTVIIDHNALAQTIVTTTFRVELTDKVSRAI